MPGLTGLAGLTGLSGLVGGYVSKVLGYGPIAYWPLYETSGATAACLVNSAQNGSYTGATLGDSTGPDGSPSPLFDGVNDFVNVWTPTFRDAFDGTEGTVMIWAKVFNVGVWTDGTARNTYRLAVDTNNQVFTSRRNITNNRIYADYEANNIVERFNVDGLVTVDWMFWTGTWSVAEGNARFYYDGSETGASPQAIGGVWAGLLGNTTTLIGASTLVPVSPWHGWLAHCAVWDSALNATQIADLAVV